MDLHNPSGTEGRISGVFKTPDDIEHNEDQKNHISYFGYIVLIRLLVSIIFASSKHKKHLKMEKRAELMLC